MQPFVSILDHLALALILTPIAAKKRRVLCNLPRFIGLNIQKHTVTNIYPFRLNHRLFSHVIHFA